MRTQYYGASSLDGFIADENHELDWLMQGHEDGPPPESSYADFIRDVGALAMGSTTYEWVVRHLGEGVDGGQGAGVWPYEQPCWVFTSRALEPHPGADVRFVEGDVRPVHEEMVEAAGGKNVWVVGGGDLAGQFHDHGLLDELIIQIAPVTLGRGAPLLPRRISFPPLRLTSSRVYGEMVEVRYEIVRE